MLTHSERKSALMLMGLMVIGAMLETLGLGLIIPALAIFMEPDLATSYPSLQPALSALGNPTQTELVVGGMLALVGLYLVKALFLAMLAWRQTRFAFGVQERLSQQLFRIYLHQPYTFHLQRNSAELIRNTIAEVGTFTFLWMLPGLLLFTEVLVLAGILALLLFVEPMGAAVVALVLGGSSWALQRMTRTRVNRWGEERQLHEGLRTQSMQEGLGGIKDMKLLGREEYFLARYDVHNTEHARVAQRQNALQQMPRLWLELLTVIGLAVLVLTMLLQGQVVSSVLLTMGLFGTAAFRLMPLGTRILSSAQSMRYGSPVLDNLYRELTLAGAGPAPDAQPASVFENRIELSNVTFTYTGAPTPALADLSSHH